MTDYQPWHICIRVCVRSLDPTWTNFATFRFVCLLAIKILHLFQKEASERIIWNYSVWGLMMNTILPSLGPTFCWRLMKKSNKFCRISSLALHWTSVLILSDWPSSLADWVCKWSQVCGIGKSGKLTHLLGPFFYWLVGALSGLGALFPTCFVQELLICRDSISYKWFNRLRCQYTSRIVKLSGFVLPWTSDIATNSDITDGITTLLRAWIRSQIQFPLFNRWVLM